jgi:chaperonin cofactor prefoldin
MRTQEKPELNTNIDTTLSALSKRSTTVPSNQSYHEMSDIPVREIDLVEQMENNLQQLQDMQSRLQFMMREIRYVMKV